MMSGNQVAKRCHVLANSKFLAVLRVPKDVFLAVAEAEERGESDTALVCDPRIFMSVLQLELPREVRLGTEAAVKTPVACGVLLGRKNYEGNR